MTAAAITTKTTFMAIVSGVTAGAITGNIGSIFTLVATGTAQASVRAVQLKICCAVVVECPEQPAVGCVTTATLSAEGRLVRILCAMAIHTVCFRLVKFVIGMTTLTRHNGVHPFERKLRELMVEAIDIAPAR